MIATTDGLIDDGDVNVHEIYFSGTKEELPRVFNVNRLFLLDRNLEGNDMHFHCQDGDYSFSNRNIDY